MVAHGRPWLASVKKLSRESTWGRTLIPALRRSSDLSQRILGICSGWSTSGAYRGAQTQSMNEVRTAAMATIFRRPQWSSQRSKRGPWIRAKWHGKTWMQQKLKLKAMEPAPAKKVFESLTHFGLSFQSHRSSSQLCDLVACSSWQP